MVFGSVRHQKHLRFTLATAVLQSHEDVAVESHPKLFHDRVDFDVTARLHFIMIAWVWMARPTCLQPFRSIDAKEVFEQVSALRNYKENCGTT